MYSKTENVHVMQTLTSVTVRTQGRKKLVYPSSQCSYTRTRTSYTHTASNHSSACSHMLPHTQTHTLLNPQSQSVCRTPSHIIPWDNASSKCTPPQPLQPAASSSSSSHFHRSSNSLSSAPIYLLSQTLPVTQQLRPANPFWKETTEQKITSPPLSHTPSLPFVFSSGLPLTPLKHHRYCQWAASLPPLFVTLHNIFFNSPLCISLV